MIEALRVVWSAGGPLMFPLALLCLLISAWVARLYPRLLAFCASGRALLAEVPSPDSPRGPLARMASWASRGGPGPRALRDRWAEARMAELSRFARDLGVLRALVAAAPLLGLLGTVRGMIGTFFVLSTRGTAGMEMLSGGISEALVTTQVGLVVALPGLIGAYAAGRRLAEAEDLAERLEVRHAGAARVRGGRR